MSETIFSIEEVFGMQSEKDRWNQMDGFVVHTSRQMIRLLISNFQSCCESWGYFWTNDDPKDFVGAEVLGVKIVDQCLNKEKAPDIYDGGVMFVDIETDRGVLQFVAYNSHNGYYGHTATVICEQLTVEENL